MIESITSKEEIFYIKGSIKKERDLAIEVLVDGLNMKDLKSSTHWIPKSTIRLKNRISPNRFIFKVDSWIFEKIKHAMMGKVIYQKNIKLVKEIPIVKDKEVSIPVSGEDGFTCCPYCDSEWLTKSDTAEVKFDHIQKNHHIFHKILISESDDDLLHILSSLPADKCKPYLSTILKMMTSNEGLSGFIVFCSNIKLRDWVREALGNLNSKEELFKLKKMICDKFIRVAIDDRLKNL